MFAGLLTKLQTKKVSMSVCLSVYMVQLEHCQSDFCESLPCVICSRGQLLILIVGEYIRTQLYFTFLSTVFHQLYLLVDVLTFKAYWLRDAPTV